MRMSKNSRNRQLGGFASGKILRDYRRLRIEVGFSYLGSNNSTQFPLGSSSRICFPPGPSMISLRKVQPADLSVATVSSSLGNISTIRFQPPGAGFWPSGMGLAALDMEPASQSVTSSRERIAI